jgi:hypothetical protein
MAMQANKQISVNVVGDVDLDLTPFLKRYKDGRIERLLKSPFLARLTARRPTAGWRRGMSSSTTAPACRHACSSPSDPPWPAGGSPSSCTSTAALSARRAPSAGRTTATPPPTRRAPGCSSCRWSTASRRSTPSPQPTTTHGARFGGWPPSPTRGSPTTRTPRARSSPAIALA